MKQHLLLRRLSLSVLLGIPTHALAQNYVWNGPFFPTPTNWSAGTWGGGVPTSSATTSLVFRNIFNDNNATFSYQANNDLANPFLLNSLSFSSLSQGIVTVGGSPLRLTGTNPVLSNIERSKGVIAADIQLNPLSGQVTLTTPAQGTLSMSGVLSSIPSSTPIIVAGNTFYKNRGFIELAGNNTFTGDVTLNSGNLLLGHSNALGNAGNVLHINGGTIGSNATALTFANNISLEGSDLNLAVQGGQFTMTGNITGAGRGLHLGAYRLPNSISGYNVAEIQGNASYTGPTVIEFSGTTTETGNPHILPSAGHLSLSGANGRLSGTSSVLVRSSGSLFLDDTVPFTGGAGRINNAAAITLSGGELVVQGSSTGNTSQTLGALIVGSGQSVVNMQPDVASNVQLTMASTTRTANGGLMDFRGTQLGLTPGPNVGNVYFTSAPALIGGGGAAGTQNISVLPYASTFGIYLVTYGANGIRPLNPASEYTTTLSAGVSNQNNYYLASSVNLNSSANTTINALVLNQSNLTLSNSKFNPGSLTITSGVINSANAAVISAPLNFGSQEAIITSSSGTLQLAGPLSGSGGMTVAGNVLLTGANTITGKLSLQGGTLAVMSPTALASFNSTIDVSGGGLYYSGPGTLNLTQTINLQGNRASFGSFGGAGSAINLLGPVIGSGGFSVSTGFVTFSSNANSYTGPTVIGSFYAGGLTINSDAQLGTDNGTLFFNASTTSGLFLNGNWTTTRPIHFQTDGMIQTNANNATINGPLTGYGGLTKQGSGSLILTTNSDYGGLVSLQQGLIVLSGQGSMLGKVTTQRGTTFAFDNSSTSISNRLPSDLTINDGSLSFIGNPASGASDSVRSLTVSGATKFYLTAPNSTSSIFSAASLTSTGGAYQFYRGDGLGQVPSGSYSRVRFTTVPGMLSGVIPGVVAAGSSAAAVGDDLATYDTGIDAAGVIGLRPLRAAEYTTISSGSVTAAAHALITGATSAFTVSPGTITLDGNGSIDMPTASTNLTPTSGSILIRSTAVNPQITGVANANVAFGANRGYIIANQNVNITTGLTGTNGLTKGGPGTVTYSGAYGVAGSLNVAEGTFVANTNLSVTSLVGYGTLQLNATRVLTLTDPASPVNATVTGAGRIVANPSAGNTSVGLYGNNTYSGGYTAQGNAGTFLGHPNGLGTGTATFSIAYSGNFLAFNFGDGGVGTVPNNIVLPSSAVSHSLVISSGLSYTIPQKVTLSGQLSGGASGATFDFALNNSPQGSGYVLSNPSNVFLGGVQVSSTLGIVANGSLGSTSNTLSFSFSQSTLRFDANAINLNRPVALTTGNGYFDTNGNNATISGVITGTRSLNKLGAGTLTLSNTNTFTGGINVSAGTLLLNGSIPSGASSIVTVQSGATLGGTGSAGGNVVVQNGGTLSPGTSPGNLNIGGSFTLGDGSNYFIELANSGFDSVTLTGASSSYLLGDGVTLSGVHLGGFVAPFGTAYKIVNNTGNSAANSGTGTFAGLNEGDLFTLDGQVFQIRYNVGTFDVTNGNFTTTSAGGSIVIAAVPEPATLAALGATLFVAAGWGYRRYRQSLLQKECNVPDQDGSLPSPE